jgi:hydroxypyruvate isomerase
MEVLVEPLNRVDNPGFLLGTLEEAAELMAAVGKPNVRLQYDVYHACAAGEDWRAALLKHAPGIGHIQFSDFPGRGEPGSGGVDWVRFFETVRGLDYDGWVGAEYVPTGETVASLGWRELI